MPKFKFVFIALSICLLSPFFGFGQKKDKDNLVDHFPTQTTDWVDANISKNAPKRQNLNVIYKSQAVGLLYGNPCAVDAAKDMGFIYTVHIKGVPGSVPKFRRAVNNTLVNIKLIFTRSPFWKLILNKRIKECRERSGDFVG